MQCAEIVAVQLTRVRQVELARGGFAPARWVFIGGAVVAANTPVPASRRAVFGVEKGHFDLVGSAWYAIWQRSDVVKTFIAELEQYPTHGDISISMDLSPAASLA